MREDSGDFAGRDTIKIRRIEVWVLRMDVWVGGGGGNLLLLQFCDRNRVDDDALMYWDVYRGSKVFARRYFSENRLFFFCLNL